MLAVNSRPKKLSALAVASAAVVSLPVTLAPAAVPAAQAAPSAVSHIGVGATESALNFSWQTNHRGTEYVKYYPTDMPLETRWVPAAEADFGALRYRSHHASISGLRTGVEYTYQIGSDKGGWSEPRTFTIAEPGEDWNFLVVSDAQIGTKGKVAEQGEAWRHTVRQATGTYPDAQFVLHAGDQVQGDPDPVVEWAEFFSPEELKKYPVAIVKGNHELRLDRLGRHFNEHVNLPNRDGKNANYYFVKDNALFIVLDTNKNSAKDIEQHGTYVRTVVAEQGEGKDWTIVSFHHAPYSHGGRYVGDDRITRIREGLSPVMSETGVDLVINGHDHMYNRTHLMNGTTPLVPETPAKAGDVLQAKEGEVVYVTANSASGSKFYDFHDRHGNERKDIKDRSQTVGTDLEIPEVAVWNQDYTADYTNVQVTAEALTVSTHNVDDGTLVDEFTIVKDQQAVPTDIPAEAPIEEPAV